MKLLKLKLRGSIGIQKGLGLDEIELDLSQFKPGLIALTGKNGAGKTTVIENLHPYRTMVSRSGSLQSHFYLKDSFRVLDFEHNGKSYQSKILIDALTSGSEAYLFEDGKPLNDGKLSTYDVELEQLLGSEELFFNSVFSGQKSKGIAELKPAERRKLFYELLTLNKYEIPLEKSKSKLKVAEIELAKIEGEITSIDVSEERKQKTENDRVQALNRQAELISKVSDTETKINTIELITDELKIEIARLEERESRNEEIESQIAETKTKIEQSNFNYTTRELELKGETTSLENEIKRLEGLTIKANEVNENLEEKKNIEKKVAGLKDELSILEKNNNAFLLNHNEMIEMLNAEKEEVKEASNNVSELQRSIDDIESLISTAENNIKTIDEVPCDEAVGNGCKFLINAYADKEKIVELRSALIKLQTERDEANEHYTTIEALYNVRVIAIGQKQREHDDDYLGVKEALELKIKFHSEKLQELNEKNLDKAKSEIDNAENEIKIINGNIANIIKSLDVLKENFNSSILELKEFANNLQEKLDLELPKKISEKIQKRSELNTSIENLKTILHGYKEDYQSVNKVVLEAESELKRIKEDESKLVNLNERKASVQKEINDWTFLCKAFDKTGIPVLKLENSGIEITSVANELLSLFENKFRIVFETTKLKADKKGYKESFDINVVEEDGVCEISNKSGGQQVWLETAIQSAISLVVRKQGRDIKTSFLDEKDGALDLANAQSYIQMIQKAHHMSGVHNTFVITHRPELLGFIPQQIKLADGYLSILN